jgi:glutathione S-transferase
MTDITIHGFAPSTYTRTARMAAIEVGIDHDLAPIAYGQPEHFELHPFGKMPILTNGDDTIFETLASVAYLDQKFGRGNLLPSASQVQNLGVISAANDYGYTPVVHIEKDNAVQLAEAEKFFDSLEGVLQFSACLAGKRPGAADLFVAPMLDYHIAEVGDDHVWPNRPKLEAWFRSISKRRSFIDTGVSES